MPQHTDLPVLASSADLADILGVTERTVNTWRNNGLDVVGSYLPAGSRTPIDLFSVEDARRMQRRNAA
ncbi:MULTISPECIES: hypothetical protein [unclassified Rhodococcus (in: high G+C Gram-positive bacteria)]|uniref:hypothetical protein n=1 Tax=unclassified Rhodococcus (in: high G+C Gram-positive bacteria) TaxID=192944 RepID=UPI00314086FF